MRSVQPSSISSAAGVMPSAVIAETVRAASSTDSKMPSSVAISLGLAQQLHRDGGRDADRAFGADEESRQIVAIGFGRFAAELHDLAAGQHHFDAGHVVHGDAVQQGMRSAGILGHVAADGAGLLAGGIGCEVKPEMRHMLGELQIDHARLHDGALVLDVDFQNAVHAGEGDHDAARLRDRAAAQSGAGAARHDGNASSRSHSHDLRKPAAQFCGKTTAPGVLLRMPASYSYSIRSSGRSRTASRPAILRRSSMTPGRLMETQASVAPQRAVDAALKLNRTVS